MLPAVVEEISQGGAAFTPRSQRQFGDLGELPVIVGSLPLGQ
jgi:hypothetical protein